MDEFCDSLRLRYGFEPAGLPQKCDGCGCNFTVEHGLSCAVGGLIIGRHDDVCLEFGALAKKALKPSAVSYEPKIRSKDEAAWVAATVVTPGSTGADVSDSEETGAAAADTNENRGDIKIHGFWTRGTDSIFDAMISDLEGRSHRQIEPEKVLAKMEKSKKAKHLAACLERRRTFTPICYTVDGMAGKETRAAEKQLARLLADKWSREYSQMVGYVRARMAIAVVRSQSRLLRGSRVRRTRQPPLIDDGAATTAMRSWREL